MAQYELPLMKQEGLWFWDIPKQPLTLQDWAVMMRPTLAIYCNKWIKAAIKGGNILHDNPNQ